MVQKVGKSSPAGKERAQDCLPPYSHPHDPFSLLSLLFSLSRFGFKKKKTERGAKATSIASFLVKEER